MRCSAIALLLLLTLAASARAGDVDRDHTLVVGLLSEPATLHPLVTTSAESRDIINLVYLKLLEEQPDFLTFAPRLAERWEFSADGLDITFHIRGGVRWSDGEAVTANDVRFTWELQTDTLVSWPSASSKKYIRDVEVIDDGTVVFHFTQRYPYQLMDANSGVILPHHLLSAVPRADIGTHGIGRAPLGCGPYRVARWEGGQYLQLDANPQYFEGAPRVARVIFRIVPDMVTLLVQLQKGEIDLLESVPRDHIEEITQQADLKLTTFPSRRFNYIAWNLGRDRLHDAAVREALTLAIDRSEIVKTIWGGYAKECVGPIHPILWAHDPSIRAIDYDPARARRALEARGWKDSDGDGFIDRNGRRFEIELLVNNNRWRVDVVTMVQNDLKKIGIDTSIRVLEFNAYLDRVLKGDYDGAFIDWKTPTTVDITDQWHTSAIPPAGYNVSRYTDADVDGWIEQARATLDVERARKLWSRVQTRIYRDQPFTFIAVPDEVVAVHARFCNVHPNAISVFANLPEWRVTPECEQ